MWKGTGIVIVIVIVFLAGLLFITQSGDELVIPLPEINDKTDDYTIDKAVVPGAIPGLESGSFGGGGGGSSSGGGSGGGERTIVCSMKQIPYSLKDFDESFVCDQYDINGCSKLTARCTVEVYNLDGIVGGDFEIEYILSESLTETEMGITRTRKTLQPGEGDEFEGVFIIEDPNGINEELKCEFITNEIPKKQVCV